jgi:uncharacterized membrane protein YesL
MSNNAEMKPEEAREGYRAAIQMISHESKVIWDSFRSLITVNTIFVGFIGAVIKLYPDFRALVPLIAVLGVLVCVVWALITTRAFGYYGYWFAWARKYEKLTLGSEQHMIQQGKKFSDGETVTAVQKRFPWFARLFRVQWLAYTVIGSFLVIYVYVLYRN